MPTESKIAQLLGNSQCEEVVHGCTCLTVAHNVEVSSTQHPCPSSINKSTHNANTQIVTIVSIAV